MNDRTGKSYAAALVLLVFAWILAAPPAALSQGYELQLAPSGSTPSCTHATLQAGTCQAPTLGYLATITDGNPADPDPCAAAGTGGQSTPYTCRYDGSDWSEFGTGTGITNVNQLPQSGATDGQVITWVNGSLEWQPQDPTGGGGGGDVVGPSGGVLDNEVVVYDSTTGKIVKSSGGVIVNGYGITFPDAPPTGVDSEMIVPENDDHGGNQDAGIVITSGTNLLANERIYASNLGLLPVEMAKCFAYRWNTTAGDRLACAIGETDQASESFTGTRTTLNQQHYRKQVPPGFDYRIIALEVIIGGTTGGGGVDDCHIGVEYKTVANRDFDPSAAGGYTDDFTVAGSLIQIGSNADNSGLSGWGDDTPYQHGQGYALPINYLLTSGYFIISARSPVPGTEDCNYINDDEITVFYQRVPE